MRIKKKLLRGLLAAMLTASGGALAYTFAATTMPIAATCPTCVDLP